MPDDTDTSSQGSSGQSAGACPDVSTVMDIQEGVNVKCGGKFCSFSCQDSEENVSRKQIQCKGAKYKLKKNESRTVKCSNDPPCGSLAPGESFDYNPNIMTVHYERTGIVRHYVRRLTGRYPEKDQNRSRTFIKVKARFMARQFSNVNLKKKKLSN